MANKFGQHWIIDTASGSVLSANPVFVNAIMFHGYAALGDTAQVSDQTGVIAKMDGTADLDPVLVHFAQPIVLRGIKVNALTSGLVTIFLD